MSPNDLKDEYLDVSENMRHYGNMRFAQLTLYVVITAAQLSILFNSDLTKPSFLICKLLELGGIIVTIVFFIMEERAVTYWDNYRIRGVDLESELGYQQFTNQPKRKMWTATNAVRGLFACIFIFWVAVIFFQ